MKKYGKSDFAIRPFVLYSPDSHSMGSSLYRYIDIKIHHLIKENNYKKIVVIGEYDRTNSVISKFEKNGKLANWQRPTAMINGDTLTIKCFPGYEYVRHYASLIATYLAINNKDSSVVTYIPPSECDCWEPINSMTLENVPIGDMVVIGFGLPQISELSNWQGNEQYMWAQKKINNKVVIFLIFKFSFWGDIIGRITTKLSDLGHKRIVFTAKCGGIQPHFIPNKQLITGSKTYIEGQLLTWDNMFSNCKDTYLAHGVHFTSPSPVYETSELLTYLGNFDFVDSEIGHFAKSAHKSGMSFGYLHFISNNLTKIYNEDLSNERMESVLQKREQVMKNIQSLLYQVV